MCCVVVLIWFWWCVFGVFDCMLGVLDNLVEFDCEYCGDGGRSIGCIWFFICLSGCFGIIYGGSCGGIEWVVCLFGFGRVGFWIKGRKRILSVGRVFYVMLRILYGERECLFLWLLICVLFV